MSNSDSGADKSSKPKLSLDTWAVLVALAAAVLIRLGLIHIPW